MSKVWLVTGSASGLGRSIAEAVLASGDRLVATARDPRRLEALVEKYGDQMRTAVLDVADEPAASAAVRVAVDAFGRLDIVVNNARYGDIAPFEQLSSERFKALVDTNFYGVVNVTRWVAALPFPGALRITPPSGLSADSPRASPRKWLPSTSRCAGVAQVILRLVASDRLPAHLLLGSDAVQYAGQAEAARAADAERWRQISVSTDATASGPIPAL